MSAGKISAFIAIAAYNQCKSELINLPEALRKDMESCSEKLKTTPHNVELIEELTYLVGVNSKYEGYFWEAVSATISVTQSAKVWSKDVNDQIYLAPFLEYDVWQIISADVDNLTGNGSRTIFINSDGVSASSYKFKNLKIDLGKAMKLAAGGFTTLNTVAEQPKPLIIAASLLLMIGTIIGLIRKPLTEEQTCVFWGMMKAGENNSWTSSQSNIIRVVNEQRQIMNRNDLEKDQIERILLELQQMSAIEPLRDGEWRIIENHKVTPKWLTT